MSKKTYLNSNLNINLDNCNDSDYIKFNFKKVINLTNFDTNLKTKINHELYPYDMMFDRKGAYVCGNKDIRYYDV
jgi:hypothetical protein